MSIIAQFRRLLTALISGAASYIIDVVFELIASVIKVFDFEDFDRSFSCKQTQFSDHHVDESDPWNSYVFEEFQVFNIRFVL